jgi:hypothetical protein
MVKLARLQTAHIFNVDDTCIPQSISRILGDSMLRALSWGITSALQLEQGCH